MENRSRPLIPVNLDALDDLDIALSSPGNGDDGDQNGGREYKNMPQNLNRADYIRVPQRGVLISRKELYKGEQFKYNWETAIFTLQENGLYMPNPDIFMNHFMNVKRASEGGAPLQDGNGRALPRNEAQTLWNYISSTNRKLFNGETCWTWLDALFKKNSSGKMYMETDHRAVAQGKKKILKGKDVNLDAHINDKDGWAELSFSKQGLANKVSSQNAYVQGSNLYFWYPRENLVAGFYAVSDRANLYCGRYPTGTYSSLGVFACAGGAASQNSGGKP